MVFVLLVAVACASGVVGAPLPASADPALPTIILGAHPVPVTQQEIGNIEADIGRPLAAIREFDRWDSAFPTPLDLWMRDTNHTLFLSLATRYGNGTPVLWRTIADAPVGSPVYNDLVSWARRIRDYGAPLYFLFSPEPEMMRNDDLGTSTDYIDAWRRVWNVFEAEGTVNAQFVWTLTDEAFWITGEHAAANWYPGDGYVDAIGADAYNWHNCKAGFPNGPWKSFFDIVNPLRLFGQNHPTIPLMLPEFGTVEDPSVPGRKAQWFNDARALLKSPGWESFRAALYFNTVDWANPGCNFLIDSSASSLTAFTAMGADPYFTAVASPPDDTTPPTAPGQPSGAAGAPGAIALTWSAATDPDDATLTYRVYRDGGPAPVGSVVSAGPNVSFTDTGLAAASTHTYVVVASDEVNTGPPSPASAPITVSSAAGAIFADDFANLAGWSSTTRLTIDAGAGSPSAPSARAQVVNQSAFANKTLAQTYPQACLSASVNLASGNNVDLFRLRTASNGPIIKAFVSSTNTLTLRSDVSGVQLNSGVALGSGWHSVELCGTVGSATTWDLYRDGVRIVNAWSANTGTTPIGWVQIGDNASKTFTMNLDHVRVDQAPGESSTPDFVPPTVPGTPTGTSPSAGTIQIAWAGSTDDSPPITYRVYRDGGGSSIGSTTATSFTDTGLAAGSMHTYAVDAVDAMNNASVSSPESAPITVSSAAGAIFADDFANLAGWSSTTRLTIDAGAGSPSAPSARAQVVNQSAFANKTLAQTYPQACLSASVNLASGNNVDLFRLRTASNGPIIKAFVSSTNTLTLRSDVSGVQLNSGVALGSGWHSVELCGTVGSATTWDLYRDGVRIVNAWSANTGTTPIGWVQIGDNASKTFTMNLDHVRVDQAPGG